MKIKTRTTHLSGIYFDIQEVSLEVQNNKMQYQKYCKEMPVYDAQANEQIGGDKAELFASIVRKARVQVDQEKVKL